MQSKFEFLNETFPKLAGYGKKAERALNFDKNICLLNLGRIAEDITKFLYEKNKIRHENPEELLKLGIIDESIYEKINSLVEIKNDALNEDYNSETACLRLINSALDLCKWFVKQSKSDSRFDFLADYFPSSEAVPILSELAEFGREAEQNLFSNTRYSVMCLGDIGESITYLLLNINNFHNERDQIDRIKILKNHSIIPNHIADILHELRMARNQAIHSRYNLISNTQNLLEQAFNVCEWIFVFLISDNDIIRCEITDEDENNVFVKIGRISGMAEKQENEFEIGEKKLFRVIDTQDEILKLTPEKQNPWTTLERNYKKYKTDQIVKAKIKSFSKSIGAVVEFRDGLIARIPDSELGRKTFSISNRALKYEVKAKIKWIDPKHYPYIIMSAKDVENLEYEIKNQERKENKKLREKKQEQPKRHLKSRNRIKAKIRQITGGTVRMTKTKEEYQKEFLRICRSGSEHEIQEAINAGVNVNVKNKSLSTALMFAAKDNTAQAVEILIQAGAYLDAIDIFGNTALIYASSFNTDDVVEVLIDSGADIEMQNILGYRALDYARQNYKLEDTEAIKKLKIN